MRYNYCRFRKHPPYWNSTSDFDIDQFVVICMLFCIRLPNFVQIGAPIAKIWRNIYFSRWRPRPLNTTSGFVFVDVTAFRMSVYQQTKFRRDISIGGWDITISVFEIQTSAMLEFYFRFRSAYHSASGCRISSKSEHPPVKYDGISILKMAAVSHVVFTLG